MWEAGGKTCMRFWSESAKRSALRFSSSSCTCCSRWLSSCIFKLACCSLPCSVLAVTPAKRPRADSAKLRSGAPPTVPSAPRSDRFARAPAAAGSPRRVPRALTCSRKGLLARSLLLIDALLHPVQLGLF